jgi:phenylacetate-CoA ligase
VTGQLTNRRLGTAPDAMHLDPAERMSSDELGALQLQRLQWTLRHAYDNVPLYRRKFDEAGVAPDDCRELADLARFPFTTKADLREAYPFGAFAVPRDRVRRIHASSGTTGRPTVVGYTQHDLDTWSDVMARSIRAAGGRPGQIVHVAYGYGLFTGGLGAHYGAERLGCTVVPVSGGMTPRQVQLIHDFEPEIIMVTPSYMLTILDEFERQGIAPRSSSLKIGIFGAEPWTEQMRAEIEQRADIDAVDIYGLSEVMGPGVANECVETKDGLHIWEDHFYPEVIDPIDEHVLPDRDSGELLFTSLTKEALAGMSPHFQLVLSREGRLDLLTVRVEARPDCPAERRDGAATELSTAVKDSIGVSVEVAVVDPETLERSVGKLKRLIDMRSE